MFFFCCFYKANFSRCLGTLSQNGSHINVTILFLLEEYWQKGIYWSEQEWGYIPHMKDEFSQKMGY